MMRRQVLSVLLVSSVIGLISSGCGGDKGPKGVKVTGSVTKDGKALEGTRVSFIPVEGKENASSRGTITNTDGKFEIKLEPGKYAVVLSRMADKSGKVPGESDDPAQDYTQLEGSGQLRQTMPEKYTDHKQTPLSIEVPPGGKDLPAFEVRA